MDLTKNMYNSENVSVRKPPRPYMNCLERLHMYKMTLFNSLDILIRKFIILDDFTALFRLTGMRADE